MKAERLLILITELRGLSRTTCILGLRVREGELSMESSVVPGLGSGGLFEKRIRRAYNL